MSPVTTGIVGIILLLTLFLLRMPVAFSMTFVGLSGFAYLTGSEPALGLLAQDIFDTFSSYPLSVIPLFILMGSFAFASGISKRLYIVLMDRTGHCRPITRDRPHDAVHEKVEALDKEPSDGASHDPAEGTIVPIIVHGPHPGVHDDELGHVLRMAQGIREPDGTTPVLDDQCHIPQAKGIDQGVQVTGVGGRQVRPVARLVREAKADVVWGDATVP